MITTKYNALIANTTCICLFVYYTVELIRLGLNANGSGLITFFVCLTAWIIFNIMNFGILKWVIINMFCLPSFKK